MPVSPLESKTYHRVIWAIDPFHDSPSLQINAVRSLIALHGPRCVLAIQPVSLLVSGRYDQETQYFLETWSELQSSAKRNLERLLKEVSCPGLAEPVLIRQDGPSQSKGVQTLIKFAIDEKADEILVSSHGRKGTQRLLMGSFAETLVLKSPLPTLVVNPKVQKHSPIKTILFPTDFSEKSEQAFDRVLRLAKEIDAKLLVFHKLRYLYPEFGYPFVVPIVSTESVRDIAEAAEEQGEEWILRGKSQGVVVKVHVGKKGGYALDEILKISRKLGNSGVIAMASQSGPVTSVLLGSLTRQVLREAPCPVLVFHPHQHTLVSRMIEEVRQTAYTAAQHPLIA